MRVTSPVAPRPGRRGSCTAACATSNTARWGSSARASPNATGSSGSPRTSCGRSSFICRCARAGAGSCRPQRGCSDVNRSRSAGGRRAAEAASPWEWASRSTTCWPSARAGRGIGRRGRGRLACQPSIRGLSRTPRCTPTPRCCFRSGSRWSCVSTPAGSPPRGPHRSRSSPMHRASGSGMAACGCAPPIVPANSSPRR